MNTQAYLDFEDLVRTLLANANYQALHIISSRMAPLLGTDYSLVSLVENAQPLVDELLKGFAKLPQNEQVARLSEAIAAIDAVGAQESKLVRGSARDIRSVVDSLILQKRWQLLSRISELFGPKYEAEYIEASQGVVIVSVLNDALVQKDVQSQIDKLYGKVIDLYNKESAAVKETDE